MKIKKGKLNHDNSGRAYPDNPEIDENWDCIWEHDGKYYKIVGSVNRAEWSRVDVKERELSLEERLELNPNIIQSITVGDLRTYIEDDSKSFNMSKMLDNNNTPTKLITITYKDDVIESYE